MSVQDPISDMLTRIRNAILARKREVEIPASKVKAAIATVLVSEGYVLDCQQKEAGVQPVLTLKLKYQGTSSVIAGLRRISRPSRRVYVKYDEIPKVQSGLGINVLSTNKGVMSDRQARGEKVGGEILCSVW